MSKDFYHQRLTALKAQLAKEKKHDLHFSIFRFFSLLTALFLFYTSVRTAENIYLALGFLLIAVFLFLLRKHQDLRAKISRTKALQRFNESEVKALDGDFTHFENGQEFLTSEHFYAHDLDVLGAHSLFQYVNRTATIGGKALLAQWLLGHGAPKEVSTQQEQIQALSKQTDFRQRFSVEGELIEEEPKLLERFEKWLGERLRLSLLANPLILYLFAAIGGALFVLWVYQPNLEHFKWLSYAFGLNLALTFAQYRHIQKAYYQLGNMAKTLGMYANFINMIEELPAEDTALGGLKNALKGEGKKASESLRKLKRILDRFDQLNNAVALVLTNGFYHNHVHALRALEFWKREHVSDLPQWLAMVHKVDALNSLANYAFNHPNHTYPEQRKEPIMQLQDAAHPLIDKDVRVANSISFSTVPYYILTGSNMSGKSTFLKTIGLNLILAKAGAPVAAKRMEFYPFKLLSSMKLVDSISKSESYFQAEVLKLKRIKEELDKEHACFVLLDEILRGTNSDDKRKGTRLFMERLKAYKAMGVLATHDIDVAELANDFPGAYTTAFFESRVEGSELIFDYVLRKGICTTPNATKLMQGYGII